MIKKIFEFVKENLLVLIVTLVCVIVFVVASCSSIGDNSNVQFGLDNSMLRDTISSEVNV